MKNKVLQPDVLMNLEKYNIEQVPEKLYRQLNLATFTVEGEDVNPYSISKKSKASLGLGTWLIDVHQYLKWKYGPVIFTDKDAMKSVSPVRHRFNTI